MNTLRITKPLGMAAGLIALLAMVSPAAVLNVSQCYQEKDQWCWNASAQMVLQFKGYQFSQTEIANWAVGGQNVPNFLYGSDATRKGVDLVLSHFGNISSTGSESAMALSTLDSEMSGSRPVVIRWGWDSGGGHIVVLRGTSGDSVYINDPWPDNGQSVNSYSWVVQGGTHTWTHTLKLQGGGTDYASLYQQNYNLAVQYYNAANATHRYDYLGYAWYYYGCAKYYYYMNLYNDTNLANAYKYYYWSDAYYYYYYGYLGNYSSGRAYWYYYMAYSYYYYARYGYYWYMARGDSSSANAWYNYYYQVALSYYYQI